MPKKCLNKAAKELEKIDVLHKFTQRGGVGLEKY